MRIDWHRVVQEEFVISYLDRSLSEAEAEAFGQHYLECDRCWAMVEQALELRAALKDSGEKIQPVSAVIPVAPRRSVPWIWSGVAAALVVGFLLWNSRTANRTTLPTLGNQAAPIEALRAPGAGFIVRAEREASGGVRLEWPAQSNALRYQIVITAIDGATVARRNSPEPRLTVTPTDLGDRAAEQLSVRIDAIDALGAVIASSSRANIPPR